MKPIRIVLIDDQQLVRAGLRMILESEPDLEIVGEAGDGAAGVALIRQTRPDLALMDLRMPVLDGVAATRRVVADPGLTCKILALTTFDTEDTALDALQAGASGFLIKDTEPEELVRAIHAVAEGDSVVSPRVLRRLLDRFRTRPSATDRPAAVDQFDAATRGDSSAGAGPTGGSGPAASAGPAPVHPTTGTLSDLTEREIEVLSLIGQGRTNREIADELVVAESTVKSHVRSVLTKLQARDRVEAVIVAHREGLVH